MAEVETQYRQTTMRESRRLRHREFHLLKKTIRNGARMLLALLFVIPLLLSLTSWGQATARTTLLLPALLSSTESAPLGWVGESIHHQQKTVSSKGGTVFLDIYAPDTQLALAGKRPGVLIIPGSGDNRQFPPFVNLLRSMARTGMVVVSMTTTTLMDYDLSAQDGDAGVQAFTVLQQQPGVDKTRTGIISFSAGVPVACFAAADPAIRDQVAYVAVFGGYFQTLNVLKAFGQRSIVADGKQERWQPTVVPMQVMGNVISKFLTYQEQVVIKRSLTPNEPPLTSEELALLTPAAQAAYHLLHGDKPADVDKYVAALPLAAHDQLVALSPSQVIDSIKAPIFLLHDRKDSSLPFTESRAFAAALQQRHHTYEYLELNIFDHVEVRSHNDFAALAGDGARLFQVLTHILQASS